MATGTNRTVSFLAAIVVIVPILVGVWFALPMFLPMYLWTKVDFRQLAQRYQLPEEALRTKFRMRVRYEPRGEGDPLPWQIIDMQPAWNTVYPKAEDETEVLVRCTFISANDGQPPSTMMIGNTYKDRYWTVEGWRLPPGALGHHPKRPVVVYDPLSKDQMDIATADMTRMTVQRWESDDLWPERDDGWEPPEGQR
ncbi:MAG: hypothetical protein NZ552_08915 [Planctomycetes bacterium]|nr:hypothetical protein [Planctomycetota bacterium]